MSLDLDSEHVASETLKKLDDLTGVDIMTLRQQWEEKAQQQGAMLKAQETARNLFSMSLSDEQVAKATGLDMDIVLKLKYEAGNRTKH